MYLPHFETSNEKSQSKLNKIYFRILFRSQVTTLRSDFNALDLYAVSRANRFFYCLTYSYILILFQDSVIGLDRYKLANKVFNELENYKN